MKQIIAAIVFYTWLVLAYIIIVANVVDLVIRAWRAIKRRVSR